MKIKLIAALLLAFALISNAQEKIIPLYPGKPPGSENWTWQEKDNANSLFKTRVVYNVVQPTLSVYLPPAALATGTAIIIAPGGAFHTLSIESEGIDVAKWLNAKGVAAFVLKYRLVHSLTADPVAELMKKMSDFKKLDEENDSVVNLAIADGLKAIEYVRTHAAEYNINPKRIGFMGFSAGGTVTMGTVFNSTETNRPNFAAPVYPYMNALKNQTIPANAPPLFICAASDDNLGLASHSTNLYNAWIAAKKPAELHMYEKGGHGFGMRKNGIPTDTWIERFGDWLGLQGLLWPQHPEGSMAGIAQKQKAYDAIYSGIPWFDDQGNTVSAHGACILKDNGQYYLFGERHSDTSNAFAGFNCYSSTDLYNWKFESVALPVQPSGKLGPNRLGERPKVMKCAKTGEYLMFMHADTLGYKDQFVGYATSAKITGPYTFKGPLLFDGKPIRKWDMGTFQDGDGSGYVLIHGGEIYKLADDYKSVSGQVNKNLVSGFESPAIFRKDGIYYLLGSDLTSWERNDNYYFTATSLNGPWTARGIFAPPGTLTWNSQTTFVLAVEGTKDTTFMFMGDRWSFPKQASAATYIWQPLTISGTSLSIPQYWESWKISTSTGAASSLAIKGKIIEDTAKGLITYSGPWRHTLSDSLSESSSDAKNAYFSVKFNGTQIGFYSLARSNGGYAHVILRNGKGKTELSSVIDMYCKYPVSTLKFLSPVFAKDNYTLTVSVMGERGNWSDKKRSDYGSSGNFVSLDKIVIKE